MKPVNKNIDMGRLRKVLEAQRSQALGSTVSSDLSEQRMRAYSYYIGDMSGDLPDIDGQSNAVSSDVQDVVEGLMPVVLDVLTSTDKLAEFTPTRAGDEPAAEQETEYVNHVFYQQNNGFLVLHNAIKDALLSKNGFVKWWMEKEETRERERYEGLTQDAFAMLAADTEVEFVDIEQYQQADPVTNAPATYYNATTECVRKYLRPKVEAFPPEEFLVSKSARTVQGADYLAHIMRKPQADVIELFPEKEDEIRAAPAALTQSDNSEAFNRQTIQDNQDGTQGDADTDDDMRLIEVAEHYIRLPLEEDGVARRYKITTVGTRYNVLDIEEVVAWPIATGTPIIMPHRFFGRAAADLAIDIQQIKTSLLRSTLNNAYFANNQRTEVSETHASENTIDDLLNNRVGGIVRTKMPGGLKPIETQPIGHWMVPIIEYVDGTTEKRTGLSKNTTGLDIDSMNHARTGAVGRIMDAAEMRVKLMTRVLAETLVVDIFRGVHGMLQQYSEEEGVAQLTGKWVTVNPREWKTRRHLKVNLPLGGMGRQQMLQFFSNVLGIQKEILQTPDNGGMVTMPNVYYTIDHTMKLAGLKGAEGFFSQPQPPDPNAPKPPDPKMVEAQAKAAATQQQTQAQIAADQQKQHSEMLMEQFKLQMQRQRDEDEFKHKQQLDQMKFAHEAQMQKIQAVFDMKLEAFKAHEEMKINAQQAKLSAEKGVGSV
jgi:hypothetical protein